MHTPCVCASVPLLVCFSGHARLYVDLHVCVPLSPGGVPVYERAICLGLWGMCFCVLMCTSLPVHWLPCLCAHVTAHGWERGADNSGPQSHTLCWAGQLGPDPHAGAAALVLSTVPLPTGMLLDIQNFFQIRDSNAGLLQTGKERVPALGLGPRAHPGAGGQAEPCPSPSTEEGALRMRGAGREGRCGWEEGERGLSPGS